MEPTDHLRRTRSANDSTLEAGLDERGEAPPPYNTASADKAPSTTRMSNMRSGDETAAGPGISMSEIQGRTTRLGHLPPGYDESTGSEEGLNVPARPAIVVVAAERLSEVDLEEQPSPDIHRERPARRAAGR
jgi:hypothetical protein